MKTLSLTSITVCLMVLLHTNVRAQSEPIQVGVKATIMGTNAISHGIDLGIDVLQPRAIASPGVTVFADIPLGQKGFFFAPALTYQSRGFEVGESISLNIFEVPIPIGATARVKTQYLQLAPDLKYKFGNGNIKGFVRGGPYVGYALDGHADLIVNSIIDIKVASIPFNTDGKLYDPWEFGANVGAGLELKAGPGNMILEANYQRSFTDFTDIPLVDVGLKNHAYGLSIGYAIPIGGKTAKTNKA